MMNLENKKIVVTGATGGIGNSIVKALSDTGAKILATGTRLEKLEELKSKFKNTDILKFDISKGEEIEEFIENATKQLGGSLDCLINNAGITQDNLAIRMNIDELELFNNELKGELTLVVSEKKEENASQKLSESDINLIKKMINKLSTKEITDLITSNKNISKKVVYNFCLKLKNEN